MESSSHRNIVLNVTFFYCAREMGWSMFINQRPWQHCLSRFKRRIGINLRCLQQGGLQHNAFASNSIPSNPWLHFNMERIQLRANWVKDRSKIILWKSRKETLAASFSQSRLLPGGKENWRFPPIINGVRSCWCFVTIIYCSFCKWWWYICYVFLVFVFTYQLKFDIRFDHHWVKIYVYSRKTPRK